MFTKVIRFIICAAVSFIPAMLFANELNLSSNRAQSLANLNFSEERSSDRFNYDKERQNFLEKMSTRDASDNIFRGNQKVSVSDVPIIYKNGILFTYIGNDDDIIHVSGSFVQWQKRLRMVESANGVFFVFWEGNLPPGKYDYKLNVNGFWQNDSKQPLSRIDQNGQRLTYFSLRKPINYHKVSPSHIEGKTFKFFLLDEDYKEVWWVGSANQFDPRVDQMKLVDGYWTIEKRVEEKYSFYAYFVDGKLMRDPHNPYLTTTDFDLEVNFIPEIFYP